LSLGKAYDRLVEKTPSLGDPQFGETYRSMLKLLALAASIIDDAELEIRKSGTIDKVKEWNREKKKLELRLRNE